MIYNPEATSNQPTLFPSVLLIPTPGPGNPNKLPSHDVFDKRSQLALGSPSTRCCDISPDFHKTETRLVVAATCQRYQRKRCTFLHRSWQSGCSFRTSPTCSVLRQQRSKSRAVVDTGWWDCSPSQSCFQNPYHCVPCY